MRRAASWYHSVFISTIEIRQIQNGYEFGNEHKHHNTYPGTFIEMKKLIWMLKMGGGGDNENNQITIIIERLEYTSPQNLNLMTTLKSLTEKKLQKC